MFVFPLYLLFFVTTNAMIYALLNDGIEISKTAKLIYSILWVSVVYMSLFTSWGMPIKILFNSLIPSFIGLTSFHFFGNYAIARIERKEDLAEDLKPRAYRLISLVFQKLSFIMVSIVQVLVVFNFAF